MNAPALSFGTTLPLHFVGQAGVVMEILADVSNLRIDLGGQFAVVTLFDLAPDVGASSTMRSATLRSSAARFDAVMPDQAGSLNADFAARTAASTSSALPRATPAQASPVYGFSLAR